MEPSREHFFQIRLRQMLKVIGPMPTDFEERLKTVITGSRIMNAVEKSRLRDALAEPFPTAPQRPS